jgi:dienelactone hydrolase
MKVRSALIGLFLLNAFFARPQSTEDQVKPILEKPLQSPSVVTFQLQEYLMGKAPKLPSPTSATEWTTEAQRIRKHLLEDVVLHGWPKAWIDAPPRFDDLGPIPAGKGYKLRKLRYEIVPGFYSIATLYEPESLQGKVPAVLNVLGHYGHIGKANEAEQTICINEALRGMIALRLEWIGVGELTNEENEHWFAGHLDLVGANGIGLFYLAMRRGLDYLWQNPNVDRKRIAMTGLSGGGWQTITLSSLDERVQLSIPVAGYESIEERLSTVVDAGDIEQNATDFLVGQDYSTLTAMRAPRPTLLINNAEDDCCFRAALVRPAIFDAVIPFFRLFEAEGALQFYENTDISAHNYERTNRQQAYRFFAKYFGLPVSEREIPVGADLKTYSELAAGVPKDNLTILGLARNMARGITRPPVPGDTAGRKSWANSQRATLKEVIRYDPVTVKQFWAVANTKHNGVESVSFRFLLSNALSATGVWLKDISTPEGAPLTIVINDKGKKASAAELWDYGPEVADRMDRNEQVLVLDLLFSGDAAPEGHAYLYVEMLAATGNRPIGMEVAQLIALADWARTAWRAPSIRLESTGIRSQLAALIASGLRPGFFAEVAVKDGMRSLSYLLEKPVKYDVDAPDLFCLDLYKDFDLDRLILLAEPTKVSEQNYVEDSPPIHTGQSVPLSFRNDTAPEGTAGPSSTGF